MRYACLLVLLVAARAEAVPCLNFNFKPTVLSPKEVEGALVVAALPDTSDRSAPDPRIDVAIQGWSFSDGTAPKVQSIAPGLAIYSGRGQLLDRMRDPLAILRPATSVKPIAAPAIKAATYHRRVNRGDGESVSVTLSSAAPARAVALVVFGSDKKGRSFGTVTGTEITVYGSAACSNVPPTTIASKQGETIFLAWLDNAGQLSAMTSAKIQ